MNARRSALAIVPTLFLIACTSSTNSTTGGTTGGTAGTTGGTTTGGMTGSLMPTGQSIVPNSVPGVLFQPLNPGLKDFPSYTVGQAVATVVSPDGKTLLILTSGYNEIVDANYGNIPDASNEYVFVFDISGTTPAQKQVLWVPNTFMGIAYSPDGTKFYVGGGKDDNIHTYAQASGKWAESTLQDGGADTIALGHECGNGLIPTAAFGCGGVNPPGTAGLAVTADGARLVIANHENDSISVVDLVSRTVAHELDLRPGKIDPAKHGVAGGEYPFGVAIKGNSTAYVSSTRDREIDVVDISGTPTLTTRIAVQGNPNNLILNKAQSLLFVACDNSDLVTVIDTSNNTVKETISTTAPPATLPSGDHYSGSSPNSLALSQDEATLYVTNGGTNSLAVITLAAGAAHQVTGLIPTGWYPHSVSVGNGGTMLYVVNGKSAPGANAGNCSSTTPDAGRSAYCGSANQYILQLEKAGFQAMPIPPAAALATLTAQVATNNGFSAIADPADVQLFAALRGKIKHVIYIVKENRTYDQILGDLPKGNGDPSIVEFGQAVTPNLHALASNFVTLDNFYDSGEVSMNGWPWSTSAREQDIGVKSTPVNYGGRGYTYDEEGQARDVDVGIGDMTARVAANPILALGGPDPDLLPGTHNPAAPDSAAGPEQGFIWDAALHAGLTVRSYGFFIDLVRYDSRTQPFGVYIPPYTNPAVDGGTVAYASNPTLAPITDPYFRGFDSNFPDFYREKEWEREFDGYVTAGNLPSLELVRLMHDHMGNFGTAIEGVNTPELQVADNDYAVGKLIQKVASSPFASSTLIIAIEDDAQDGPDHVDAHRSIAFFAGPYVKQGGVVIATHYTTVNILRTIEDILGLQHLSVYDAYQRPMSDVFDLNQTTWGFTATAPAMLKSSTSLPIALLDLKRLHLRPTHNAAYWASRTKGFDFSAEDRIDSARFNQIVWEGLKGKQPYPSVRSGRDLRLNREELLRPTKSHPRLKLAAAELR